MRFWAKLVTGLKSSPNKVVEQYPRTAVIQVLLVVTVLCASFTVYVRADIRQADTRAGAPIATSMMAARGENSVLVADQAFFSQSEFFVRYRSGNQLYFTGGDWGDRIDLTRVLPDTHYTGPYLLPLQYLSLIHI